MNVMNLPLSNREKKEDKMQAFVNVLKEKDGKEILIQKVRSLFVGEFEEKFHNIMLERKEDFLENLSQRVKLLLQDQYSEDIFGNWKEKMEIKLDQEEDNSEVQGENLDLNEIIKEELERLRKESYTLNYKVISNYLANMERKCKREGVNSTNSSKSSKNIEIPPFLRNFRKHCGSMSEAFHICGEKMLEITDENCVLSETPKVTHLICLKCKKVYLPNCIHLFCNHCDTDYYSCHFSGEDSDLQPATWNKYHCGAIINDKMHCIKCKDVFYLNCKTGKLECTNPDCLFEVDPMRIQWTCMICKEEFKTEPKIYNPLEFKNIRSAIKECLMMKVKAKPQSVPCCAKVNLNINQAVFYHKKECEGKVFLGELSGKKIVVCEKCKTMNFFEKYIWTCPACYKRFRIKGDKDKVDGNDKDDCTTPRKSISERGPKLEKSESKSDLISTPTPNSNLRDYQRKNSQLAFYERSADGNGVTPQKFDERKSALETKPKTKLSNTDLRSISGKDFSNNVQLGIGMFKFSPELRRKRTEDPPVINSCPFQLRPMNGKETNSSNINSNSNNINLNLNISLKKSLMEDFNKAIIEEEEEKKVEKVNLNLINIININQNPKRMQSKPPIPNVKANNNEKNKIAKKLNLSGYISLETKLEEEKIPTNNIQINSIEKLPTSPTNNLVKINIEDYKLIKQVGEGSYGKIYLVEHKVRKEYFALKKIIAHSKQEIDEFKNEYELMNTISRNEYSRNYILKILGVCVKELDKTTFALYVLMELADSDWEKEIFSRSKNKQFYSEEDLITMMKSIIKTLAEMQRENISHRDLKPQNILIFNQSKGKKPVYKIADFGEAKAMKMSKQAQQQNTLRGTELYMSPILFISLRKENTKVSDSNDYKACKISHNAFKSDVFSLGYCLFFAATLTFRSLYDIRELQDMHAVAPIVKKYLKDRYSSNFTSLVIRMVETNEKYRPDFIQLEEYVEANF